MKKIKYQTFDCVEIANEHVAMLATISVGPRIISLKTPSSDNLFAVIPDITLDCPGSGPFHLYGGHRLWHAPEDPPITYLPDDSPVGAESIEGGVRLIQDVEPKTSLQRQLEIRLIDGQASVEVKHRLVNQGEKTHTLAPWAITQLKPGGVGILPQYKGLSENNPTLPNRWIVLWPYTDINTEYITWGNDWILIRAQMKDGMLKVGFPNPEGWLAYWIDGTLFVKRAVYVQDAEYFDRGSSSECYCSADFIELETLGPISALPPGASVEHVEVWNVYDDIAWTDDLGDILSAIG